MTCWTQFDVVSCRPLPVGHNFTGAWCSPGVVCLLNKAFKVSLVDDCLDRQLLLQSRPGCGVGLGNQKSDVESSDTKQRSMMEKGYMGILSPVLADREAVI